MEKVSVIFSKISFIGVGLLNGILGMVRAGDTQGEIGTVMKGSGGYFRGEDESITGIDRSMLFETIMRNIILNPPVRLYPFVKSTELVKFYYAADIGVWPKQESTSQLDAVSCGLPIIISSNVEDTNRISGHGISYNHGDPKDLSCKILSLEEKLLRKSLDDKGIAKIQQFYSWDYISQSRMEDFKKSL